MDTLDLLVLAAGAGVRMKRDRPKQFLELAGKPIIVHTMTVYEQLPYVGNRYVTAAPEHMHETEDILSRHGITGFKVVEGGKVRSESVRNGLRYVETERVITQNAVLPFVTAELIDNVVAEDYDCATTVTPLEFNLCRGDEFAEHIVERDGLKLINSPQTFRTQLFKECHERAAREGFIPKSDCELMLHYGCTVRFVPGDTANFKVTTQLDLAVAEAIMRDPVLAVH